VRWQSDLFRDSTELRSVFRIAFARRGRLRQVVAKRSDYASGCQLSKHCLRLVRTNTWFGIEPIQLGKRQRDYNAVDSTSWRRHKCSTLANPKGKPID
jgi:hypothetical protein